MPTPLNIDRFNKTTLLALDWLYQSFPAPLSLDVTKLAVETLPADAEFDETFSSIEPAYWAVNFLVSEGFITHEGATLDGHTFSHARLTAKSLAILGATPAALEKQQSMSERIRALLKTGAKEASSEAAKKLVELLFTHAPAIANFMSSAAKP